jgi:trafficking protein particle complex subunit 4
MIQDCFRTYHNQQSWRLDLQSKLPRWRAQPDQHERLLGLSRHFSRVRIPRTYHARRSLTDCSVHAITTRLDPLKSGPDRTSTTSVGMLTRPEPPSGLEVLESENFRLQCFNTMTGTKFLLFTDTTQANVDVIIRRIYDMYADYVMKNPFYQLEMPVRCEMFDRKLLSYLREINNR